MPTFESIAGRLWKTQFLRTRPQLTLSAKVQQCTVSHYNAFSLRFRIKIFIDFRPYLIEFVGSQTTITFHVSGLIKNYIDNLVKWQIVFWSTGCLIHFAKHPAQGDLISFLGKWYETLYTFRLSDLKMVYIV